MHWVDPVLDPLAVLFDVPVKVSIVVVTWFLQNRSNRICRWFGDPNLQSDTAGSSL